MTVDLIEILLFSWAGRDPREKQEKEGSSFSLMEAVLLEALESIDAFRFEVLSLGEQVPMKNIIWIGNLTLAKK